MTPVATGALSPQPGSQETQSWLLQVNPVITQHRKKVGSEGFFIGSPHEHWLSEAWLHRPHVVPISCLLFTTQPRPCCSTCYQFVVWAIINNTLSYNPENLMQHSTVWLVMFKSNSTTYSALGILKSYSLPQFSHLQNGYNSGTYLIWLRLFGL